jgi:lysophospholipid acyltransferase (LPLAT)-like uncharacterized protein
MGKIILSSRSADNLRLITELAEKLGVKVESLSTKKKENNLLQQIEMGLQDVKDIQNGKQKRKSLKDMLNG